MKKPTKQKMHDLKIKLKPFWNKRRKLESNFHKKEDKLQKEMNDKLNLDVELEFFYVDGECVGIGARDYNKRKNFPLVHDSELEEEN